MSIFFVYIFPLAKRRSKINMEKTLEHIEEIDFLMLNRNELFIEEENPSEELAISEEETAALETSAMKECWGSPQVNIYWWKEWEYESS